MQGYLSPDRKLSEHWQPILQLIDSEHHGSSSARATQAGNSSSGLSGMVGRCAAEGCKITISVHFPHVRNATAARLVGSGAVQGHQPAQAAAADWQDHLERFFGNDVSLQGEGDNLLGVSVSPPILQVCCFSVLHIFFVYLCKQLLLRPTADLTILQSVIPSCYDWPVSTDPSNSGTHRVCKCMCAPQEALQWLAEQPAVHWLAPGAPLSLRNWQGTAISQSASAAPDAPVALLADHGSHPIWAAGLTGQGQIVGAGDSGIGALQSAVACAGCMPLL